MVGTWLWQLLCKTNTIDGEQQQLTRGDSSLSTVTRTVCLSASWPWTRSLSVTSLCRSTSPSSSPSALTTTSASSEWATCSVWLRLSATRQSSLKMPTASSSRCVELSEPDHSILNHFRSQCVRCFFVERHVWLKPPLSSCLNRTQPRGLGRTLLWRSCTCSVRRAAAWTTGFLRSASRSADLGPGSSLAQMLWSFLSGNTHPDEQDDPVSAHPWILLRRIPIQAARRRPEGAHRERSPLVPSMPRWLSFFMWMRSGMPQERHIDPHSLCGWGLERKEKRVLRPVVPQSKCRTLKHAQPEKKRCWERGVLKKGLFKDVLFAEQHVNSCSQRKCFPLSRIVLIL